MHIWQAWKIEFSYTCKDTREIIMRGPCQTTHEPLMKVQICYSFCYSWPSRIGAHWLQIAFVEEHQGRVAAVPLEEELDLARRQQLHRGVHRRLRPHQERAVEWVSRFLYILVY